MSANPEPEMPRHAALDTPPARKPETGDGPQGPGQEVVSSRSHWPSRPESLARLNMLGWVFAFGGIVMPWGSRYYLHEDNEVFGHLHHAAELAEGRFVFVATIAGVFLGLITLLNRRAIPWVGRMMMLASVIVLLGSLYAAVGINLIADQAQDTVSTMSIKRFDVVLGGYLSIIGGLLAAVASTRLDGWISRQRDADEQA